MKNKFLKINKKQKGLPAVSAHAGQSGFTLVETLVAVLILTLSVGALLSLASGGFYSVRYSRNQIVANNLLQESIEYIRNTRDTAFENGLTWDLWQQQILSVDSTGKPTGDTSGGCFHKNGCYVDPFVNSENIKQCDESCPYVQYYPDNSFYGYNGSYPFSISTQPYQTSFIRKIVITPSERSPDQLIVNATISWENGSTLKSLSQSTLITNWKQ